MKLRALFILFATALVGAAAACGGASGDDSRGNDGVDTRSGAPLVKVRVAISPHISNAPLMIAKSERFFEEEGLDVSLVTAMRPEESLVALITGDIDVQPGPIHAAFLSAITRGAPIRMVAGMAELKPGGCPYFGIVVRKGIDTAGTPNLQKMRASQDGVTRYVVSRMLASRNLEIGDIETVRLPEAVMAMSLENGSLDAAAVSEPALTRVARAGTLWLKGEDALPGFQWGILAFGERFRSRERETGIRFLRAYQRGVARANEGKTERNVAIIAEHTGASPDDVRDACWPGFRPDSRINWESIAQFQAWANRERLMERTVTSAQAYDTTFLAAALAAGPDRSPSP